MTANQTNIHFESRGIEFVVKTAEDLSALQASMRKYFEGLQLWPHVDSAKHDLINRMRLSYAIL